MSSLHITTGNVCLSSSHLPLVSSPRWIVPVIACHLGALAGAWTYYLAVEVNWPDLEEDDQEKMIGRRVHHAQAPGGHRNGHYQGERNGNGHYPDLRQQPPENPGYTGTMSRGHSRAESRPHTPEDEKYQPIKVINNEGSMMSSKLSFGSQSKLEGGPGAVR